MRKLGLLFLIYCSLATAPDIHAASSENYIQDTSVFPSGGGTASSASYVNTSTVGQPSPLGQSSSENFINAAGFWQAGTVQHLLQVTTAGTGTGSVTVNPGALAWNGGVGTAYYASGTYVDLSAAGGAGSTFTGWSGDSDCADGSVTMDMAKNCIATFTLNTYALTVLLTGNGTVTSSPAGISCGADCSEDYVHGSVVTLSPTPATGSGFSGWSGDPDCADGTVTMNAGTTCTAVFSLLTYSLTVTTSGTGTGTVTGAGVYDYGTIVVLTAAPDAGSTFAGWSGDPDCTDGMVTVSAAKSCTAAFMSLQGSCAWTLDQGRRTACVQDAVALQACLTGAERDGYDNIILVGQGTYRGPFWYQGAEPRSLEVSGGWLNGCQTRQYVPYFTALDGDTDDDGTPNGVVLTLRNTSADAPGGVTVDGLFLRNGVYAGRSGGCLQADGDLQDIVINGNMATECSGYEGGAVQTFTALGKTVITNNILFGNTAVMSGGGLFAKTAFGGVVVLNNTVLDNAVTDASGIGAGIAVAFGNTGSWADVANNIAWNNDAVQAASCDDLSVISDIDGDGTHGTLAVLNNAVTTADAVCATTPGFTLDPGNLTETDPQFEDPVNWNYHLQAASPFIDQGLGTHPDLPARDHHGGPRVVGLGVDVGANEELVCTGCTPPSEATLTPDAASPQTVGSNITFTASAAGGTGPYEYKFYSRPSSTTKWKTERIYAPQNTWTWNTAAYPAGTYSIMVQVRNVGSAASSESARSVIYKLTNPPVTGATLSADPSGPQVTGASITFTAGAIGGIGPHGYKFFRKDPGGTTWTLMRNYSTDTGFTWNTTGLAAGTYSMMVQVRSAGSTAASEAFKSVSYKLIDPPATGATLAPDPASPKPAGTLVTFTAGGIGGTGSYEYKFFRRDPGATTWTLVRNYTTNNILTWDTTGLAPGTYTFLAYVRTAGSTPAYDAVKAVSYRLE